MTWQRINKRMVGGIYLVTNNIRARDTHGGMSHIWLTKLICKTQGEEKDCFGRFVCFDEADRRICNLTHYIDLGKTPGFANEVVECPTWPEKEGADGR